ncbi:hypothetical protein MferCBS31731_002970 [Microsporum ferrugineum]
MGQSFCLIAPHRRRRLGWRGKLGEVLFDGTAFQLVPFFARPVVHVEDTDEPLVIQGKVIPRKKRRRVDSSSASHAARPPLLQLPNEIHHLIFDSLDIKGVFILGITCQQFWDIARFKIKQYFASYLGRLAGTPVVCVGDGTDRGGNVIYPQGLLSSKDVRELQEGLDVDELEDGLPDECANKPINLYDVAFNRYRVYRSDGGSFPSKLLHICLEYIHKDPCPDDMLGVSHPTLSDFYPKSQEWVLRNLTTREFVLPTAVALQKKHIKGPLINVLGFGEVILSRVCWSTDDFTSMGWEGIHRGVWAGHSLDIVPSTYLDSGGPWKDISDEVSREIAEIWKSEYGEDWRNVISDNRPRYW